MKLTGLIFDGNINSNGRVYGDEVISKSIKDFKEKGLFFGELNPPKYDGVLDFGNVSHTIDSIYKKHNRLPRKIKKHKKKIGTYDSWKKHNNKYFIDITLLDTASGNLAKDLINQDIMKSASVKPRGLGVVDDGIVNNFEIASFDICSDK